MKPQPAPTDPCPTNPPSASQCGAGELDLAAQLAADTQYYRRILHGLIDIGVDLAQQVHQEAKSEPQAAESGSAATAMQDLTMRFERIARTIRRTIALARKLAEPVKSPVIRDPATARTEARRRIIREVEDAIDRVPRPTAASLHEEFRERLDDPDLEDDIENRPIADIITEICHDLALDGGYSIQHRPWKRRTPEDVTALRTRAARPRPTAPAATILRAPPPDIRTGSDPP